MIASLTIDKEINQQCWTYIDCFIRKIGIGTSILCMKHSYAAAFYRETFRIGVDANYPLRSVLCIPAQNM